MKMALGRGRFLLAERDKNLRDLAELGMVVADVYQVLQRLSVSDYCQGPLDDERGRAKQWWVFGPRYEGMVLYVKVCVNRNGCVECLSFHRAAHPLPYPLLGREGQP
ncbi:type II toxin-antitoxin system MqsR family toxin [Carboxydochorda subterranea]|uniref:Type II toxin-antitoxin system MqsR family toxin n=1 Tax=Carboxydichorda subterranea TaxID=3109565 RepID=A0ABZ1C194_9FIRM|nr:type II toxin-antitoxin system MqsR family toxin [Limnochorda sp. L945t]WRP18865.1 type II toxin-antitoxin system MqsR family toxin [Limnochorda sp. L945t]